MMRLISLTAALVLVLAACGDPTAENTAPNSNQPDPDAGPVEDTGGDAGSDADTDNNDNHNDDEPWHDVDTDEPRDHKGPIGGDRPVEPIFPEGYDVEGNHPLLILLHGYGSDAQETLEGFDAYDEADERGVVMLAPEGHEDFADEKFWNATETCCDHANEGVDDVGYLSDLIEEAVERYAVDPERIFLLGISNGAFMAHRMACDRGQRVRSIVSFNGGTTMEPEDCAPDDPVEIVHVHGTEDEVIAYDGGPLAPPAREAVERWADWNDCAPEPVQGPSVTVTDAVDGQETDVEYWEECTDRGFVEFWTMNDAGHVPLPLADFPQLMFDTLLGEP